MTNKKIILTTIFESELYTKDLEFEIEKIQELEKCDYTTAKRLLKGYNFEENVLEQISNEKTDYYLGDFWNIPSILRDNKHGINWEIYVDKENNEVIFGAGTEIDEDGNQEIIDEFDSDYQNLYYDIYQELFEAQKANLSETEHLIEVDNLDFNGDGSPTEYSDTSKADYILKILGDNGNYFGFWEYNEK